MELVGKMVFTMLTMLLVSLQQPYSDEPTVDLLTNGCVPKNIGSYKDGAGMCVASSIQGLMNNQEIFGYQEFREWAAHRPEGGGAGPSKVDMYFREYPKAKNTPPVQYVSVEGEGTLELIKSALKSGRGVAATDGGDKTFYRQYVYHMTNIVKYDEVSNTVWIVDNNRLIVEKVPYAEWVNRHSFGGRWAIVLLERPTLPVPHLPNQRNTQQANTGMNKHSLLATTLLLSTPMLSLGQWGGYPCPTPTQVSQGNSVVYTERYEWYYDTPNCVAELRVNGLNVVGKYDFKTKTFYNTQGVPVPCPMKEPQPTPGMRLDTTPNQVGNNNGILTGYDPSEVQRKGNRTIAKVNGKEVEYGEALRTIQDTRITDTAKPCIVIKGNKYVDLWDKLTMSNEEVKNINAHCKVYKYKDGDTKGLVDKLGYANGVTVLTPVVEGHSTHIELFSDESKMSTRNLVKAVQKADPNYKPVTVQPDPVLPGVGDNPTGILLAVAIVAGVLVFVPAKRKPVSEDNV